MKLSDLSRMNWAVATQGKGVFWALYPSRKALTFQMSSQTLGNDPCRTT